MVLTSDDNIFHSGVIEDITNKDKLELRDIIQSEYKKAVEKYNGCHPSLMITFPNFRSIKTIQDIFEVINNSYPDLPMFGGASAIDFGDTTQDFNEFYDGIVYNGAMPFVFIKTKEKPLIVYESISDFTKCADIEDKKMVGIITDCEESYIKTIDNMPAYEFIRNSIDVELDNSELFIMYPILVSEENCSYTRVILNLDRKTGYLYIAGSINIGAKVEVQVLSHDFIERSSKIAMENTMAKMENKNNLNNAIIVSCACRKLVNIFDKERETEIIKEHICEKVNLIGFYSFGEISPIKDTTNKVYNFYNNETLSICLF